MDGATEFLKMCSIVCCIKGTATFEINPSIVKVYCDILLDTTSFSKI